ncbi:PTS system mannose/fructose/sorbose family transporter subunit IID [Tetragenococcus halophilus]|uniref:PTS system mannose/fructose/sorbose family transporter subunit IID n=1 Tax=Tetragenococcus halophilus TaxID=51669 RepID=UPI0015BE361A|nr:PTS system mannose/fructose/sorbose family transporter subunit IID [Tetragenococcus halophilus]NWO01251.1 PTS system mannose/fructose/sorbose family transporter subunit IID [Tetragenococcus halophilus]
MAKSNQLTKEEKKLLRQMYWRSFTLYAAVTPAKQGASGVSYSMQPFLNTFYDDKESKRQAMKRQMGYFNTNIAFLPFLLGVTASMEKENAQRENFNEESISAVKASLMGPLAGIGDSLFWGVLRVIAASIALTLANAGNILAPIVFLLFFNVPVQFIRWYGGKIGYTLGNQYVSDLYESGMINVLTRAASIVGLVMVGAMTSDMVEFTLDWNMVVDGETVLESQEMLDQIFVGLIPLAVTLFCFWLLKKKGVSVNWLIVGVIVASILCAAAGIA